MSNTRIHETENNLLDDLLSSPDLRESIAKAVSCAVAIDRHDSMYEDNDLASEAFSPLPWIWITGEPGVGKKNCLSFMIKKCEQRDLFETMHCRSVREDLSWSVLFGDGCDSFHKPKELQGGLFWQVDMGFLVLIDPEHLPLRCQEELVRWRELIEMQLYKGHGDWQIVDLATIFLTSHDPRELVNQGKVLPELFLQNSVEIWLPPFRQRQPIDKVRYLEVFLNMARVMHRTVPEKRPMSKHLNTAAQKVVTEYTWPDNMIGFRRFADYCVLNGIIKDHKDRITGEQAEMVLAAIYGSSSERFKQHPGQTGSSLLGLVPTVEETPREKPDRSEWPRIFLEMYRGKPGAVKKMSQDYGINRSLLSTTLNAAGINSGKGGRPSTRKRAEDS